MPDQSNLTPLQSAWLGYTGSLRILLVPVIDDRPLDQFLQFREETLALVEGPEFIGALSNVGPPTASDQVNNLLLRELRAFPLAVEVAATLNSSGTESKSWIPKWLDRAKVVSGSVKDLLENAPPVVKAGLTVLGELLDLFKAR